MATVELSFTPLPAHVRTARLVATAVARRSGVEESLLDEVRLAVGEACSRAVEAHRLHCPAEPVRIELSDRDGRFEVVVTDAVPGGVEIPRRRPCNARAPTASPAPPIAADSATVRPALPVASAVGGLAAEEWRPRCSDRRLRQPGRWRDRPSSDPAGAEARPAPPVDVQGGGVNGTPSCRDRARRDCRARRRRPDLRHGRWRQHPDELAPSGPLGSLSIRITIRRQISP